MVRRKNFEFLLHACPFKHSIGYTMKFFLSVVGMILIIEGLPYFAFPEKIKAWLIKVISIPASQLRTFGFLAMCLGMALVYLGQKSNFF